MIRLDLGACRDADPELFDGATDDPATVDAARAICARCAIRLDCLALAFASPDAPGIWGGLTREQRNVMAARRREHTEDDAPLGLQSGSSADQDMIDVSTDCILNHLYAAALTLTTALRDRALDPVVANRVRDALTGLDAACKEIHRSAFAQKIC